MTVLVGVLLLALLPNTGAIPADSSCSYGTCPNPTAGPAPIWYALLALLVLVAAVLGVVLLMRRRRQSTPPGSVEPWSGPAPGALGSPSAPLDETGPGGAVAPAYLESPEDYGNAPPEAVAETPPPSEGGADIDSLMKELDKISGEILQRGKTAPKTPPTQGEEDDADK